MSGKTILYVEDNAVNRRLVRDLLQRTTYALVESVDGEAGVAKALEIRPDLILMDIQLPKISGLEAMRRIRAGVPTANTPARSAIRSASSISAMPPAIVTVWACSYPRLIVYTA